MPLEPLSAFAGESARGIWRLRIIDDYEGDTGQLNEWSLNICSFDQVLSAKESSLKDFKIYPNPVTDGRVYIVTADNQPKTIRIFDVLGTPVLETTLIGKELNLNGLNSGMYLIQVFEKDKVATRKLIVK